MALTLNSNWLNACLRSSAEHRHLVKIYDNSGLRWQITDGLVSELAAPAINDVSTVAAELDPKTRIAEIGRVTIDVLDEWIRPIHSTERLKGMRAELYLGERSLALSDFEQYFTGFIDDIIAQPDGLRALIEVLDIWAVIKDQEIVGAWANQHPLEVIEDIYANRVGLSASFYDATTLDPSDSANVNNSHLVVNRASFAWAPFLGDETVREPTSAQDLIKELLEIIDGVQVPSEAGKLGVKIFDSTAAAVAHWDEDEIEELEQLEDWGTMINRVSIAAPADKTYEQNDTDSQSNHAHGKATGHIAPLKIDNPWIKGNMIAAIGEYIFTDKTLVLQPHSGVSGHTNNYPLSSQPTWARPLSTPINSQNWTHYDNSPTTEGTFNGGTGHAASDVITLADGTTISVLAVDGGGAVTFFTVNSAGSDGTAPVGFDLNQTSTTGSGTGFYLTPDDDNVTELRPLYFEIYNFSGNLRETIKITSVPSGSGNKVIQTYVDPSDASGSAVRTTSFAGAATYKVKRGALGSSANFIGRGTQMIDITPQVFMANNILNRYGNDAAPKIRVRTSLKQFAVAVADLVTIDWSQYLGYGADGIDNTTKWQVLSKAVEIGGPSPGIEWTLLRATTGTSTRTHNAWRDQMRRGYEGYHAAKTLAGDGLGKVRVTRVPGWNGNGISVELVSGFNVKLNSGLLSDLASAVRADEIASETLSASKDIYIYVDSVRGQWVIKEVTLGAARPDQEPEEVPVAKVVTDGSGVTSIADLTKESTGTAISEVMGWENMPKTELPNGSFGDW